MGWRETFRLACSFVPRQGLEALLVELREHGMARLLCPYTTMRNPGGWFYCCPFGKALMDGAALTTPDEVELAFLHLCSHLEYCTGERGAIRHFTVPLATGEITDALLLAELESVLAQEVEPCPATNADA